MLTSYIRALLARAKYERLEDGQWYAQIDECPGVWGEGVDRESCGSTLQEVLEEWIVLKLRDHDPLPVVEGIDLNIKAA